MCEEQKRLTRWHGKLTPPVLKIEKISNYFTDLIYFRGKNGQIISSPSLQLNSKLHKVIMRCREERGKSLSSVEKLFSEVKSLFSE